MTITGQALQGARVGQLRLGPGIELRALAQVGHVAEGPMLAGRFDTTGILFAKTLDHAQPHADRRLSALHGFETAIPIAGAHVHRADRQLMPAGILEDLVRTVEPHGPTVDQGTGERRRFVAFEPTAGVGQQGETGGVGFGKTVIAEAFDLFEDLRCESSGVAVFFIPCARRSRWGSNPP